jgi:hypothetical protein
MTSLLPASVDSVLAVLVPLVDEVPEAEDIHTGWWYLLVVVGLVAALVLLWLSLRKQLKKIRFDEEPSASDEDVKHPPAE